MTGEMLRGLWRKAAENTHTAKDKIRYRSVSAEEAARIKDATGHDVNGYSHSLDGSAARHILNEHGDPAIEAKRGLLPITENDIAMLPQIIRNWDSLEPSSTRQGLQALLYRKRVGDELFFVEEVRTGRKELAGKTMYKKTATATADDTFSGASPSHTPEALRSPDTNIPPSPPGGQPAKPWGPVRGIIEGLIGTTGRSADGMLKQISKRGITAVDELRAMFHPEVGGERVIGETFHEGVQKGLADFMGRFDKSIGGLSRTTADDVARLARSGEAKGNGPLHRKAQEVRAILDDLHGYLKQAGVDLYSPRARMSESLTNSTRGIELSFIRLSEVAPCAARSSHY